MSSPVNPQKSISPTADSRQQQSQQAQKLVLWRECLTKLPDSIFFDLMRMYLGEIKTPYNKQNLIQKLSSFLHKEQVQKTILMLLSPQECQILAAIAVLDQPSQETLEALFAAELTATELHENLMSLEERLVIFRNTIGLLPRQIPPFAINPILEPVLLSRIHPACLLPPPKEFQGQAEASPLPPLTPALLAAVFSFIREFPSLCRQDGSLKKRAVQQLSQVFPFVFTEEVLLLFQTLITSLQNLSLLKETARGFSADYQLWLNFAQLPFPLQAAYLAAAACGRDSKGNLQKKAGQFLAMTRLCPPEGFAQDTCQRLEFLLEQVSPQKWLASQGSPQAAEAAAPVRSQLRPKAGGRFAQLMETAERKRLAQNHGKTAEEDSLPEALPLQDKPHHWCKSLLEAGTRLGIFRRLGTGQGIAGSIQPVLQPHLPPDIAQVPERGHLTMDSSLTATLLPGLSLSQLLPLMTFMRLRRYDTAISLEITKNACLQCFDQGLTPQDIQHRLSAYLLHDPPQSLSVSLEDWHHSYSLATLYKGYVLHLQNKKDISAHPILARHIVRELEKGIYLMDFADDQEAQEVLARGGFENTGSVKTALTATSLPSFSQEGASFPVEPFPIECYGDKIDWKTQELLQQRHVTEMEGRLAEMELAPHQREGLQFRISRRILLLPEQLQGSSVRMEQLEASGMDFVGKVHVAEQALDHSALLRLTYIRQGGEPQIVTGFPQKLQKTQGDSLVTLQGQDGQELGAYSLGQAHSVRRILGSIFAAKYPSPRQP